MPPKIVLRSALHQYAISYPLPASRRVLMQRDTETQLALTVSDTHDLGMELLGYGDAGEVLAPAALRTWMRQQHAITPLVPWPPG